ncbi:winged helix-turn-helix domain-containing protein [Paenibacillus sp. NFR01]|uniref:winged helix-turn-helix domain-containing protein n=1 Tax=Paenibacillus sp. NFR01 TaxID=1566279 RepID=UPI0008B89A07|nr:crosslink repair DNA glycosylase YcaQ family protein [Paenibacillus sp. NFR01]SET40881.1 hypothetical protein SAMN03159358_1594 [Paenibacillus sp. NFR01]
MADIMLSKSEARTFLAVYHGLHGEYELEGKEGIMAYIRRVGCIQYDPLNVVGMNAELVLQSRIKNFDRRMLSELLYADRRLIDYWDKNMAIFPVEDWPYFYRRRALHQGWCDANPEAAERTRAEIELRGPLCSGDLDDNEKVEWAWGPTRMSRAALEGMYHAGHLGVHHKSGTRKYYDLASRLLPEGVYGKPDPFKTDEDFYAWSVLRRIGSVGLLWNKPSDAWLGINGLKTAQRMAAFAALLADGAITEVQVEDWPQPLYLRTRDLAVLERSLSLRTDTAAIPSRASVLAPLDNLLWDRKLILELFGFEYRWEVYKPVPERKWGYYVLPVLYGDRLIARFEPAKQRGKAPLRILKWWWEEDAVADEATRAAVIAALERFAAYLGTHYDAAEFVW